MNTARRRLKPRAAIWYNSAMNEHQIPGIDSSMPPNTAVSVYSQDGMDDFPVLKAFQQYIDAEQAKARKRLVALGIFFGILTGAVIAVFVVMLASMSHRNQLLNDRLVEFAMKERDRPAAPVVVQPAAPQADSSALVSALTAKLDAMEKKLAESQSKPVQVVQDSQPAAAKADAPKASSAEALEIQRLHALLAAEREKAAVEKERRRQEELEAYRRKHYPELYRQPQPVAERRRLPTRRRASAARDDGEDEIDAIVAELENDDDEAVSYFDEEDDEDSSARRPAKPAKKKAKSKPAKPAPQQTEPTPAPQPKAEPAQEKPEPAYSIPVDVKKPERRWRIPVE